MDQEKAAKLAALLLMLRSGGAQTAPNGNPAALAGALRSYQPQVEVGPPGLTNINRAPVQNPNPASPLAAPTIGVRG
jgi:hypothetical protein